MSPIHARGRSLDTPDRRPAGCGPSRFRGSSPRLSLLAGVVLLALAAGGSPDPLWVGGIFDGADFDDLLVLGADLDLPDPPRVIPSPETWHEVPLLVVPPRPSAPETPLLPRAPPLA